MSWRLCRGTVRLLAVLWTASQCGAEQSQPAPTANPEDVLDRLMTLISRTVKTATDPIVAELNSQRTLLDDIARRLSSQDSRIDSLNTRLDSLNSRLDTVSSQYDSRLDSLNSDLDSRLDSRLDSLNSGLDSRLDLLNSGLDSRLDSRLDSFNTRLDGLSQECAARTVPNDLPWDCSDLPAGARSGVYQIVPGLNRSDSVRVFCDMLTDGGGWTVLQRRADVLPRQNFYRNWSEYKNGFGELTAEFWWGLEKLWLMTSPLDRRYELRVDLEDFDGEKRYAVYQDFRISSESDGYRLKGGSYTGNAGDSMTAKHFGQQFTTKDKDQDKKTGHNCAELRKGAWWYNNCHDANLNGEYLSGNTADDVYGVNWKAWKGWFYSLKSAEMKIRPTTKSA